MLFRSLAGRTYAILLRHDIDVDKSKELATSFESAVRLGGGHGTLIAPRWVITAAHVAEGLRIGQRVRFRNGTESRVSRVIFHPDWKGRPSFEAADMALVRLAHSIDGITPARLNAAAGEEGSSIWLVGSGVTGDGRTGPTHEDEVFRAATNIIDAADERFLRFTFSEPPDATELEGISGPGDSGGPAYRKTDDGWEIIGVSSMNDGPGGNRCCRYGSDEYYSRISTSIEWIRSVIESSD